MGREVRRKQRQVMERKSKKERERWINGLFLERETLLRKGRWESRGEMGAETDSPEGPQGEGCGPPRRGPGAPGWRGTQGAQLREAFALGNSRPGVLVTAPAPQAGVCWPGDRQPPSQ